MNKSQKTILVTGGSGLVGQGIRLALEKHDLTESNERWIFSSSNDVDLRSTEQTFAYFEQIRPTHVIHLAAKVGGLFANMSDNLGFFVSQFSNAKLVYCASDLNFIEFCYICLIFTYESGTLRT